MSLHHSSGMTLVETVVASAIAGILIFAMLSFIQFMYSEQNKLVEYHDRSAAVFNLLNDIRAQAAKHQKNFAPALTTTSSILNPTSLPIAVSRNYMGPTAGCPTCTTHMGYVVRPSLGMPGVFVATIRYVEGTKPPLDYEFLVVPK